MSNSPKAIAQKAQKIICAFFFISCFVFIFSCASPHKGVSDAPLKRDPAIVSGVLPNGMSYHILKNSRPANRILFRLVVKAGSILEDEDQRGIAHLVEHMAFSGTEHFAQNDLVHYFESIGMTFGPDVNAYTSFDETVYQLEIPADNEEILKKGLTVMEDWARGITFEETALQRERDVVIEEWRMGRGFSGRVQEKMFPFIFENSRYAERLPIGLPDIVKNTPRERVIDFYKKWYQNELISIVIVGDIDASAMEAALKEHFAHDEKTARDAAQKSEPRPEFSAPISKKQRSLIITDPESTYPVVQMYELFPSERVRTEYDYKQRLLRDIASSVLGERFAEKAEQADAPFVYADSTFYQIIRPLSTSSSAFIPKDGQFEQAFKSVLDEIDRFERFGITQDEFERQKSNLLTYARQAWQNRSNTESSVLVRSLVAGVLYNTPVISPDDDFSLITRNVEGITLGEINKTAKKYFASRGKLLIVTAPENVLPEQKAIEALWKNYRSPVPLKQIENFGTERALFEPPEDFLAGKVSAEKNLSAKNGSPAVTELTLSNGSRVLICPTDFKADTFLFTAINRGGLSLLSDIDSLTASHAAEYLELSGLNGFSQAEITKMLAGKQLSIYPRITQTTASLNGSASFTDIETYFQFIHLYFTAPYFTQSAWDRLLSNMEIEIQGRNNNPQNVFFDQLLAYVYDNSLRYMNETEQTMLLLNAERAEHFYRDFFSDAGKFTFIFTGDVDVETIKSLSEIYIASLSPSTRARTEAHITAPVFPKGKKTITVHKGLEEQGIVAIIGGGEDPAQFANALVEQELISLMDSLAQIRLREAMREKLGGVYSVSVGTSLSIYPSRRFMTQIFFGCDPARTAEFIAVVESELQKLKSAPISAEEITMLKETFTRKRETGVKTNNFWHNSFVRNIGTRLDAESFADEAAVLQNITPQTISRFFQVYLSLDNAVTGILLPE
jgi:zinc protease